MRKFIATLIFTFLSVTVLANHTLADDPVLRFTSVSNHSVIWGITNAGDGSDRVFLVKANGQIFIVENGNNLPTAFLDIQALVSHDGLETGLLDMAFAPDYATSGYFYVAYTNAANSIVLDRFKVSGNPNVADVNSRQNILTTPKTQGHNTFTRLEFGPAGMLYVSQGDDGFAGTGEDNAQDGSNLLGKLLRIDVDPSHGTYAIPPDNPFVGNGAVRDEIWALGLRDSTGVSFDRGTGDLFIADYADRESEINFQTARSGGGENYGWNVMEGPSCIIGGCNRDNFNLPVASYFTNGSCIVVGGEVYRGNAYPNMTGMYFYGDVCSGIIWGLRRQGDEWVSLQLADTTFEVSSWGLGEDGSLYVANWGGGVYLVSDGDVVPEPDFGLNAGFNDAWYYIPTAGQGFFIIVWEELETVFVSWFTYDTERPAGGVMAILGEPGHRWITAQGPFEGGTATLDVSLSTGGVFDSEQPAVGAAQKIGTMTITWTDCNTGVVSYNIPSLGLMGTVPITRVVTENVALCEALQ